MDPATNAPSAKPASANGDGVSLLQSLLSSINSKAAPRRALFSIPLEMGPHFCVGVKGFVILKRQEPIKSCNVWVGGETPQIATLSTSLLASDTARTVAKSELCKAYKFGGDNITFTLGEAKQIRECFGDSIIRIIGFKPASSLPLWANTGKATFIFPSEADYVGSIRAFSSLRRKLLQDDKIGIVWFMPRRNATPTIAAMIAGVERLGEHGEQAMPPGLWLVPLPFVDDIRQMPECGVEKTTLELTDMMRTMIQRLQLPKGLYDPSRYPSPCTCWPQALAASDG